MFAVSHRQGSRFLAFLFVLALGACDSAPASPDAGLDAGDRDDDAATDGGSDAAGPDSDVCDELGLAREPLRPPGGPAAFDAVAGELTVETLAGTFVLRDQWTGCDSYIFVNYAPTSYGDALFATFPDALVLNGPRNVHYFFTSYERDSAAIRTRMEALRAGVEEGFELFEVSEEDRAFWRSRMHFVIEPLPEVSGSIGELARTQPIVHHAFAIARDQRFDPLGSLFQLTRSGFTPDFGMAAYAGHYYNYLAALRERLTAETGVTIVPLMDEADVTTRVLDRVGSLPGAAAMAAFDTLEIDLEVHCRQDPEGCSEWDRNAYVHLCDDETCATAQELVRWITPYSRPGRYRWIMDASPLLALLREGGDRTFRITMGPEWEEPTPSDVRASLRLSRRGAGPLASEAALAFTGGEFDASYNSARDPFRFTPPADARMVELVVIVSGHGQTDGDNCAEWCNHEHTFTVNGAASHRIDFPDQAGRPLGCAERSSEGVVPGQWGNWAPSRAAWCPGFPVAARRFDVTSEVSLGTENELTYRGTFEGLEPRGGTIDLSAYIVYYR